MPKVFYCSNCSLQHERPVGKKCQYADQGESLPSDVEVAAPPSSDIRADPAAVAAARGKNGFNGQEGAADGSSTGPGQLTGRSDRF